MKIRTIMALCAGAMIAIGSAVLAAQRDPAPRPAAPTAEQPAARAAAESFIIDNVHSSVIFKIQHMGVANFYGRFNELSGNYTIDAANPGNSGFNVEVKADSVDTKNERRDGHLKSPDFFNVDDFPSITFKSTKVVPVSSTQLNVTGDLTLHGVTKPVTVSMLLFAGRQTQHGYRGGFETTFKIKRTEFDMASSAAASVPPEGGLGDEVEITVAVEGTKPS